MSATAWNPLLEPARLRFWQLMLRGIEQSGCKVLEVVALREHVLELESIIPATPGPGGA